MTTIAAKVILASTHAHQPAATLWTILARYPRFIHAEFMTHRAKAINAASSRAIPTARLIADAQHDPAIPLSWGRNQPGMQAGAEISNRIFLPTGEVLSRERAWLHARDQAVAAARAFLEAGYHKQICNRLLEPFTHITVLFSTTNLANILHLRDHPDAEPHMQLLARAIRDAAQAHTPQVRAPGEWHLPFITPEEHASAAASAATPALLQLSVARCASTSYKTVEGYDMTPARARAIYERLLSSPMHATPFEHIAQPDALLSNGAWATPHLHGPFWGFCQLRKQFPNEAKHSADPWQHQPAAPQAPADSTSQSTK